MTISLGTGMQALSRAIKNMIPRYPELEIQSRIRFVPHSTRLIRFQ
jgi:hypothetical protein